MLDIYKLESNLSLSLSSCIKSSLNKYINDWIIFRTVI